MLEFVIYGECASAKNQRRIVTPRHGGRPMLIKSEKALSYERAVKKQAPRQDPLLLGPLYFAVTMFYASERPDLDPGLLLDALQGLVYKNDRQIREMHIYHAIDKSNPRAEVRIEPLQGDLLASPGERAA